MSDARRGLPLLSEPPPTLAPPDSEIACRKCSKEFNLIFVRSRKCNHCGYLYCHTCTDFQALMPRSGSDTGYDAMHVCGFCIEFLTITAAGRNSLKALPLAKLKKYMLSYDIKIDRAVEKDDIIDAIVAAREPSGCLSRANENFYRKYSVPNRASGRTRGLFSRSGQNSTSAPPRPPPRPASTPRYEFPRPDLEPDHPPQPYHTYRPPDGPPPPHHSRPHQQQQHNSPPRPPQHRPNSHYSPPPPHHQHSQYYAPPSMPPPGSSHADGGSRGYRSNYGYGGHVPPTPSYMTRPQPPAQQSQPQPNYHSHSSPPRAAPHTSAPPPPPPPPRPRAVSVAPPPNLDQLVEMATDSIGSLSISALKSILFTNHVTTGQILEKGDLVKKVLVLVADEKAERARQRLMEEREEMEQLQREMERTGHFEEHIETGWQQDEERDREANDSGAHGSDNEDKENEGEREPSRSHKSSAPASPPHLKSTGSPFERPGICVICQDDDANIAIIDCGHMAMCKPCSELVMASSRECPLCRTRIVTEARLLRIFRT